MATTPDLKSGALRLEGSTPSPDTIMVLNNEKHTS